MCFLGAKVTNLLLYVQNNIPKNVFFLHNPSWMCAENVLFIKKRTQKRHGVLLLLSSVV